MKYNILFYILVLTVFCACSKDNSINLKEVDDVCTMMDDLVFMKYCYDNFDVNNDGKVSMSEAEAVRSISVDGKGIHSLKGIEYFTQLTDLRCGYNELSSLDVRNNTALTYLFCPNNQITTLDVRNNTVLKGLSCSYNQLSALDVRNNTALKGFYCDHNTITTLDISKNTALGELTCNRNQLSTLDVSNNTALKYLHCEDNPNLTELWMKTGQSIPTLWYDSFVTTIYYK